MVTPDACHARPGRYATREEQEAAEKLWAETAEQRGEGDFVGPGGKRFKTVRPP